MATLKRSKEAITTFPYPWDNGISGKIVHVVDPAFLRIIDERVVREIKLAQIDHEIEMAELEKKTLERMRTALKGH